MELKLRANTSNVAMGGPFAGAHLLTMFLPSWSLPSRDAILHWQDSSSKALPPALPTYPSAVEVATTILVRKTCSWITKYGWILIPKRSMILNTQKITGYTYYLELRHTIKLLVEVTI
jgi:hypothetical protein